MRVQNRSYVVLSRHEIARDCFEDMPGLEVTCICSGKNCGQPAVLPDFTIVPYWILAEPPYHQESGDYTGERRGD